MATALAGKGGRVRINGTPTSNVALVDNWTGTLATALQDQSALGDSWTSDVPTLKTLSGTVAGKWDVASDAGQTTLHNAVLNGATVGLNLLADETNSHGYELTAYIDSFQTTDPVAGLVTFSCNFKSQGQVFFE